MPITFIDIEKQKTWRIGIFYFILLCLYYIVAIAFVQGIFFIFPIFFIKTGSIFIWDNPHTLLIIFIFCVFLSVIHFYFSSFNAVQNVMKNIEATIPDTNDGIHKRFINILNEIQIASGNVKKIQPMVIPSLSMNALAVSDLRGESAVAITEGLLSRLSRQQLEAVLAHESYHIISGDCLEATIATSLFGLYAAMLDKLQSFGEDEKREGGLHPAFIFFWILVKMSYLLNLLISREREYRADAASVRMTRNPVALAEALYLISNNWRGTGTISSGLEMLCVINPKESEIDESEGFWANLISTHPPIKKRIKTLLNMAHLSLSDMEKKINDKQEKAEDIETTENRYYVLDKSNQWQGPYTTSELKEISWISPGTWIKKFSSEDIERASEDDFLNYLFLEHLTSSHSKHISDIKCPLCKQPLLKIPYERTYIYRCHYCRGSLVDNDKIHRILARREQKFNERITALAKAVQLDNQKNLFYRKNNNTKLETRQLIRCPKCQNFMMKRFYSLAYLVEIDRCGICNVTWFESDELEILQCVIENKITANSI